MIPKTQTRTFFFILSISFLVSQLFTNIIYVEAKEKSMEEPVSITYYETKKPDKNPEKKIEKPKLYFNPVIEIGEVKKDDSKKVLKEACNIEFLGNFKLTFYCPCKKCCGKDPSDEEYGITSTTTVATEGRTIAVDPKYIPYGSKIFIEGYGLFIAEDCGGAIKNNRIDIFMDSHSKCWDYGIDYQDIYIIKEPQIYDYK
jgi:3D (Asp-Asp-Asp) domain-containing protein